MFASGSKVAGGAAAYTSRFFVHLGAVQELPTGVVTTILYNTELYDNDSEVVNGKFTAKAAGYYHLTAACQISTVSGAYYCQLHMQKNGTALANDRKAANNLSGYQMLRICVDVYLEVNDYIEVKALQGTGSTQDLSAGLDNNHFSGFRYA